jgi:hypothetical protein
MGKAIDVVCSHAQIHLNGMGKLFSYPQCNVFLARTTLATDSLKGRFTALAASDDGDNF